ncbi:hypothetical protein F1642_14655 [Paracoccus sp. NBH48]|nr:hypothetical protein [Paracoccus sp. NBH48]
MENHRIGTTRLSELETLTDYGQINFELRKIATLFLQADGAGEWLKGAIQLFSVMGGVAYERKDFTLGGIHRALSEGEGDLQKHIKNLSQTAKEPALRTELAGMAKLETKTLSSYKSVLNNAGFDLWANPHIDDMTSASDFTFNDLRREKTSIYFVVAEADLEPLAGLVRLFFQRACCDDPESDAGERRALSCNDNSGRVSSSRKDDCCCTCDDDHSGFPRSNCNYYSDNPCAGLNLLLRRTALDTRRCGVEALHDAIRGNDDRGSFQSLWHDEQTGDHAVSTSRPWSAGYVDRTNR